MRVVITSITTRAVHSQGAMSVKAFVIGISGAMAALAVAALVYLAWDTHRMALRGDAAATFIEQQLIRQAQQQPK